MNESDFTKYIVEISQQLGAISSKLDSVCNSLLAHEGRISRLEETIAKMNGKNKDGNSNADEDLKSQLLKMLAKGLIIGLTIIGSLTGATKMLQQTMNNNQQQQEIQK